MRTFGFILAAAAAATLTLMAAPAAFAADAAVTWKGLDLTTDSGRAELSTRIDTAAHRICHGGPITGTRINRAPSRSCIDEARHRIRAQLATKLPATALAAPTNLASNPGSNSGTSNALASAAETDPEAR